MRRLLALVPALVAAVVFLGSVTTGHISMDDWGYIYGCPFVKDGLSLANVAAAFTQFGYDAFWMPLTFISYMADITLFGGGWAVHHAVCVAIHAANAALAFVLMKRLASVFAPEASPRETALACLAAALFWALHPMRAEAVVYIAARKDVLWTFFALLGLIAWTDHVRGGGRLAFFLATACCALACLSKPTAVCFPFLAFALEWALAGRFPRRIWRYAPMLAMAVAVGAITLYCQSNPIDHERLDVFGEPLWWRLLNAAVAFGMYLWHVVAPGGIRFDYRAVFPLPGVKRQIPGLRCGAGAFCRGVALLWSAAPRGALARCGLGDSVHRPGERRPRHRQRRPRLRRPLLLFPGARRLARPRRGAP